MICYKLGKIVHKMRIDSIHLHRLLCSLCIFNPQRVSVPIDVRDRIILDKRPKRSKNPLCQFPFICHPLSLYCPFTEISCDSAGLPVAVPSIALLVFSKTLSMVESICCVITPAPTRLPLASLVPVCVIMVMIAMTANKAITTTTTSKMCAIVSFICLSFPRIPRTEKETHLFNFIKRDLLANCQQKSDKKEYSYHTSIFLVCKELFLFFIVLSFEIEKPLDIVLKTMYCIFCVFILSSPRKGNKRREK